MLIIEKSLIRRQEPRASRSGSAPDPVLPVTQVTIIWITRRNGWRRRGVTPAEVSGKIACHSRDIASRPWSVVSIRRIDQLWLESIDGVIGKNLRLIAGRI